jgi:alkylation response protein AidB-like acyl-CoA dehydrogenase
VTVELSAERHALAAAIGEFGRRAAGSREQHERLNAEAEHGHHRGIYAKLAALGWLGVCIPEAYGGGGGGAVDMCVLIEGVHYWRLPVAGTGVSLIVAGAYERFGTDEQKRQILGGITAGRVEAISMSEPEAGSDVASLATKAVRDGSHYVLDGQKTWCSAAHVADHILVVARTATGSSKHQGLSMISVATDSDGLQIRGIDTMGGREVNDVYFDGCRVPASALLGSENNGWRQLMAGLNHERLIIAAQAVGQARRAFDDVLAYVKERRQFGAPIGSFQAISHQIAQLATEIELCRGFVYRLAAAVDATPGTTFPREASMAKLTATELAKKTTLAAMQMMGGYGYAVEYGMEEQVRRALVLPIVGGTSEIQRSIIAASYGL